MEIVVVDDGSTDDTAAVAAHYSQVRYVWQENQGLSAARNTGIRAGAGRRLVFLDADDRLLPDALEVGVRYLDAHPECAFVSGHFRLISADGSVLEEWPPEKVGDRHYVEFLRRNYVAMHATVMYDRVVFDAVGDFDVSLRACEDYDLYMRIARRFPVGRHAGLTAEYRRHGTNMSDNSRLMLNTSLEVLSRQRPHVVGYRESERALAHGVRFYRDYYGAGPLAQQASSQFRAGDRRGAAISALTLLRNHPRGFAVRVGRRLRSAAQNLRSRAQMSVSSTGPETPPTVSVIMIFLNAERFLAESIESVLAQTYPDWSCCSLTTGPRTAAAILRRVAQRRTRTRYATSRALAL
ncbi:MAG: glycosyltransferase [Chloroflexia bacterium]